MKFPSLYLYLGAILLIIAGMTTSSAQVVGSGKPNHSIKTAKKRTIDD